MTNAIAAVLLPAIATCVNPVPIIALIALLGTDHPRRNGAVYMATMIVIFGIVATLDLAVIGQTTGKAASAQASNVLSLVFGLVFLVVAVRQWLQKQTPEGQEPAWMRRFDQIGVLGCMITGVMLVNYALVSSATGAVAESTTAAAQRAVAVLVYVILATITLTIPYALYLIMPERSMRLLVPFKSWLTRRSRLILTIVFGAMGLLFAGQGIAGLLAG